MSKLHFRYSAMNAGKSLDLISTAHNYKELGKNVLVLIPDVVGTKKVTSRAGLEVDATVIRHSDRLLDTVFLRAERIACILVDEAQFLSESQVRELRVIASIHDIPVICYGLRTDFTGSLFEGSKALLAVADELQEKPTLCWCGKTARATLRIVNGIVTKDGESIVIKGQDDHIEYKSVCYRHFLRGEANIK